MVLEDIGDWKLKTYLWPPTDDCKKPDVYLYGFDEDYQPYLVRWEKNNANKGWVAITLAEHKDSGSSAIPREYRDDTVGKLIKHWAYAPLLLRTIIRLKAEKASKKKDD